MMRRLTGLRPSSWWFGRLCRRPRPRTAVKGVLTPKERLIEQREAEDDEPNLPARSQGFTSPAEEEVVARGPVAMKTKFRMEVDHRLYTTKPCAEPMGVTYAPVTACRACKNARRGVKHL